MTASRSPFRTVSPRATSTCSITPEIWGLTLTSLRGVIVPLAMTVRRIVAWNGWIVRYSVADRVVRG